MGIEINNIKNNALLRADAIETPIGMMLAIVDDDALKVLEFIDSSGIKSSIALWIKKLRQPISIGNNGVLAAIQEELDLYFLGRLKKFRVTLQASGSDFQQKVWQELLQTPYGHRRSYQEQALAIGMPKANRAVGNANALNPIAIIIPCHRIVKNNGDIGGYAGGVERKKWLLAHELKNAGIG